MAKAINIPKRLKAWRKYMTAQLSAAGGLEKELSAGGTQLYLKLLKDQSEKNGEGFAFTQELAAAKLNLPTGTYITYEQGHRTPRAAAHLYILSQTAIPETTTNGDRANRRTDAERKTRRAKESQKATRGN